MLLFEHLTIAAIAALIFAYFFKDRLKLKRSEIVLVVAAGSLLPDFIDKPDYFLFGIGRSLMHSCVIIAILFIIAYILLRKNRKNH